MEIRKKWFADYKNAIYSNDIEEAKRILLDNITKDQMIYRYCRGLNRDLNNLRNHKLWLSNVSYFNDPYDCLLSVDCGVKWQCAPSERKDAFEAFEKQIEVDKKLNEIRNSVFVTCFSESNCSFPMWGYYASEHKGLCLGYNLYMLIKKYNCMPVIYSDSLMLSEENDIENNLLASVLTKSSEWKHEEEWRIVKFDQDHKGLTGIILENFLLPEEIYVGCKQTLSEKDNVFMRSQKTDTSLLYADFNDIIDFADDNYVKAYLPVLSKKEYKLRDRVLILNH